jgi:hypothetical protein
VSEGVMTYAQCMDEADKRGLDVRVPKNNELFIDIDSEEQLAMFHRQLAVFLKRTDAAWSMRPSPGGLPYHVHIVVTLTKRVVTNAERILLQAVLGSDPMRELLSWERIEIGDPHPTLFFEKRVPAVLVEDK